MPLLRVENDQSRGFAREQGTDSIADGAMPEVEKRFTTTTHRESPYARDGRASVLTVKGVNGLMRLAKSVPCDQPLEQM